MTILKKIFSLSIPILISQWAGVAFVFFDTVMLGHQSPESVQAMALAISVFNIVYIGFMGIVHAMIPICAQLYGAKQYHRIGEMFGQGIYLSLFLCLIAMILLAYPDPWLSLSGDLKPEVLYDLKMYLFISMLALPALLLFRVIYSICNAVQKTKVIMYIGLVGAGLKLLLNYLLIFEPFGLPGFGSTGAAISTLTIAWVNIILGLYFMKKHAFFKQFKIRLGRPIKRYQKELFKLGLPMGGSYLVEISAFNFMTLLAAQEGTLVSGANQIVANLSSILYTLPSSLGIAVASLTGAQIGARRFTSAYETVIGGIITNTIMSILMIAGLLFFKNSIIELYSNNQDIIIITSSLFMILPIVTLFDATQCVCSCLLRAYKIAALPFVTQTVCFVVLGLGLGWLFGYGPLSGDMLWATNLVTQGAPTGISSMWFFFTVGLLSYSLICFTWIIYIAKDFRNEYGNEGYRPI